MKTLRQPDARRCTYCQTSSLNFEVRTVSMAAKQVLRVECVECLYILNIRSYPKECQNATKSLSSSSLRVDIRKANERERERKSQRGESSENAISIRYFAVLISFEKADGSFYDDSIDTWYTTEMRTSRISREGS